MTTKEDYEEIGKTKDGEIVDLIGIFEGVQE